MSIQMLVLLVFELTNRGLPQVNNVHERGGFAVRRPGESYDIRIGGGAINARDALLRFDTSGKGIRKEGRAGVLTSHALLINHERK